MHTDASTRAPGKSNRNGATALRRAAAALVAVAALVDVDAAMAHGGDDYPDETVPSAARTIIENSTSGDSPTIIYVGIATLVLVGLGVLLGNIVKSRREGQTHLDPTTTTHGVDERPTDESSDESSN